MGQYFAQPIIQRLPSASHPDTTPPTFAGISGLAANSDGSLSPSWLAATEAVSLPVEYHVYIAIGSVSAAALFVNGNRALAVFGLTTKLFTDASGLTLVPGQIYTVGVRAEDASLNVDSNVAIMTATVTYNLYTLVQAIQTTIGTPAGASIAADLAEIEAETDGIAAIPTNPVLTPHFDSVIGTPANASIAADLAEIEAETDQIATVDSHVLAIPTTPALASVELGHFNTLSSQIGNIQNSTNFSATVPTLMDQQFGAGTEAYTFYAQIFSFAGGAPLDPDSNILHMTVKDSGGAILQAQISMTRDGVGKYHGIFTVTSAMGDADVYVFFDYSLSSVAYEQIRTSKLEALSTDSANIVAIKAKTDQLNFVGVNVAAQAQVVADKTGYTPDSGTAAQITGIKAKTDTLPASPADQVTSLAIKAKTDQLTFTGSNVNANAQVTVDDSTITSIKSDTVAIKAKTDLLPSDPASNANVTSVGMAVAAVAGNVWEQLIAAHNTVGTFGANAQTPAINPTQVADAVWDALTAAHVAPGSFGLNAQTPSLDAAQVAAAVWDVAQAAHNTLGTTGGSLAAAGGAGASLGTLVGIVMDDAPMQGVLGSDNKALVGVLSES